MFLFALDEAKSLGLEIVPNIQSEWNLGGPTITPRFTAKHIVYSKTKISGGKRISQKLETPMSKKDFYKDYCCTGNSYKQKDYNK